MKLSSNNFIMSLNKINVPLEKNCKMLHILKFAFPLQNRNHFLWEKNRLSLYMLNIIRINNS